MGLGEAFRLDHLLKAPAFTDPDKTLAARQIFTIVRAFILSSIFLQLLQIALSPRITARWLALLLGTVLVSLALLVLNRRGHVRAAAFVMVLSLWLLTGIFAWTRSGLGTRAAYGYFIVVFIAGMVLGKWPGIITAVICSFSTLGIALAGPVRSNDPYRFWLVNSLYLLIVMLLQHLASRSIRESLSTARSELHERRLAEFELRKSEERFRVMFEAGPIGIVTVDASFHFSMANRAFCVMVGYREEELRRMRYLDITHRDHAGGDRESVQKLLSGAIPFYKTEKRYVKKDGGTVWGAVTVSVIRGTEGQFLHYLALIEDITTRKQAEKDREQVISLLQATLESSADGLLVIDSSGKITNFNQRFVQMWRIPDCVMATRDDNQALDYVLDQLVDPQAFMAKVSELYEAPEQESFDLLEFKDGRFFERYSRPQVVAGRPLGRVWSFRDISERKRAELALQESEYRYRMLFEASSDSIFVMRENLFFDCNSKTLEMFGCRRDQIIGFSPDRFSPPLQPDGRRSGEKALEKIHAAYAGEPQFFAWTHLRADGTAFDAEVSLARIDLATDVLLLAMVRDISQRKKLEEQLLQAQKMEAIGILAGGVAHDFNNILSTIVGYGSLLQMKLPPASPLKEYAERILAGSERAANLTGSLLTFSRKQEAELLPIDLNDAISSFHRVLARLIGEDIDFRLHLADCNLVVEADVRQIEQVLMNLVNNSRDAMPRGGRLTIATAALSLDAGSGGVPPGSYAAIAVTDTGTGMAKDIQDRIFEPFFTTKDVGKGTGLGLAIAYGIVKKHSGFITVDSVPGKGTTVTVHLPLRSKAGRDLERKDIDRIPTGSETILLIEDDAAVRQVTRSMLEEFGYTVLEASDGISAQFVFQEHGQRIGLVLCDLLMPRLNGSETLAGLRKIRPGIKAIFISGYTADVIAQKGLADSGVHLLMKPLNPAALLNKVRSVLDGG
jgi:PAS domain S-box-containing protein